MYRDAQAALKFLTEGLGFTQVASYPGATEGSIAHAELPWPGGGGVMVSSAGREGTSRTSFTRSPTTRSRSISSHDDPDA